MKKRKVTIRVPTDKRNSRKSETALFANFVHQKDAFIAMKVIRWIAKNTNSHVYTVHDNFLTNAKIAHKVPSAYSNALNMLPS